MNILVLNAGSSSQKISLFKLPQALPLTPLQPAWQINLKVNWQEVGQEQWQEVLAKKLSELWTGGNKFLNSAQDIDIVGHRIVHGGKKYLKSVLIDKTVEKDIESFFQLAPLHNEINLAGIKAIEQVLGSNIPQVAVFDTAFHRTLPLEASLYPVPYQWYEKYDIHKLAFMVSIINIAANEQHN